MLSDSTRKCFEAIYAADLVYSPGCWQLCGDANCCNFTRYKSQMKIIGKSHRQELPLLPGEYEYLQQAAGAGLSQSNGLEGYGKHDHAVIEYPISRGVLRIELLVGHTPGCACNHATRTTVCRLYPLLPIFETDGRLVGVDTRFGMFEEIEAVARIEPACKLTSLPFAEMGKFLAITSAIAQNPMAMFYLTAYRLAKRHAAEQLAANQARAGAKSPPALALFESLFLLRRLIDHDVLRKQLDELADRYFEKYGSAFSLSQS